MIARLRFLLELLEGLRAPAREAGWKGVALGLWWMVLFLVVFATIGRATKFIYVDF
jgi:hypothetical protein